MINHIELAKDHCNHIHTDEASDENTFVEFTANQLAAFTNAIIEQCAKVADNRQKQVGDFTNEFLILASKIREFKVKG